MTDLDFDELDRAVNSVMSDKKPDVEAPSPLTTPAASEVKTDSQIQKRASGLYMDMMPMKPQAPVVTLKDHGASVISGKSSSDTAATIKEPPKTIAPFHDILPPKVATSPSDTTTSKNADIESEQPLADKEPSSVLSPALDSLLELEVDSPSQGHAELAPLTEGPEAKPEKPIETVSPFLADAKVEKRPLGAVDLGEQGKESTESSVAEKEPDKNANPLVPAEAANTLPLNGLQPEDNQQVSSTPMPPEFHEDLLAVEADTQTDTVSGKSFKSPDTIDQASAAQVGPLSITQQYQEKMSTGDPSHTPIYDTNVQPLNHPAHNKSGWGGVAWIIALTVLGVGIAATLYFTGIL